MAEKIEDHGNLRNIRFEASEYSVGYRGNFCDIPAWVKHSLDYTILYWKDLLEGVYLTPKQLAQEISQYNNPLAQIESEFLMALDTDEVLGEELLDKYAVLVEKRQLRRITKEDMRQNSSNISDAIT